MKIIIAYVVVLIVIGGAIFAFEKYANPIAVPSNTATNSSGDTREQATANTPPEDTADVIAELDTNFGVIELALFTKDAPKTVANFSKLAKDRFYNGTKFHRVIKGFMIQGGDPNSKDNDWSDDGRGGPGYTFEDEINSHKLVRGVVAMANSGPNTNGSQFFIVTAESTPWLDGKHTVFGKVTKGMDVVDKIENVPIDTAKGDHPTQDVVVQEVKIIKTISVNTTVKP